jgi:TonB family protein
MKKLTVTLLYLLLFTFSAFAQSDTSYIDHKGNRVDRESAVYYRITTHKDGKYYIEDYYLNGNIQMRGALSSIEGRGVKDGDFTYYYADGAVMAKGKYADNKHTGTWGRYAHTKERLISMLQYKDDSLDGHAIYYDTISTFVSTEGYFRNGKRTDEWKYYTANRKHWLYCTKNYLPDSRVTVMRYFDTLGHLAFTGKMIDKDIIGTWKYFYLTDTAATDTTHLQCVESYVNNNLDGARTYYYKNGVIKRVESYSFGKFNSGKCFNEQGVEIPYFAAKQNAKPPFEINDYLKNHLKYPAKARKHKIEGRVIVQFTVDENGDVSDAEIKSGIGGGCDEEAVRIIYAMPRWQPCMIEGKAEKQKYTLPITFKLD